MNFDFEISKVNVFGTLKSWEHLFQSRPVLEGLHFSRDTTRKSSKLFPFLKMAEIYEKVSILNQYCT